MEQIITGAKGGSSGSGDSGGNRGAEIASIAYMKILLALSEGEIAGGFTGRDIYLDGTPLVDDNGNNNFPGVIWDWRPGTISQDYIAGFPAVENEISIGTEIKYGTPWVRAINNTQLSAVRIRFKCPNGLYYMRDSGGKNGIKVEFVIDISTDGGAYVEYGTDAADGIADTGYERSYRVDLPAAKSGWSVRVRRLTANASDGRTADTTRIESVTDIIDAKLSYPNTGLLFVQFDSKLFDGKTPTVTVKAKGKIIRVPANYDPVSHTYSGVWDGTFKWAWSNNPAWVFYDILLSVRYGLGRRISAAQVDKWTLYQIGQYCDSSVSDGAGGMEPRLLCDLYLASRADAWTVLMDLANIFRGMIGWYNGMLTVDADMPRAMDPDFVFNKSNIVGSVSFSSSSEKSNYSAAIVTYSNPANHYSDDQASVMVRDLSERFGFNVYEMSAVGCTRNSDGQRRGLWAIETNRDDNAVEFKTGKEGRIPRPGKIIGLSNGRQTGRANGGRVSAVSGKKITLDRLTTAKAGDMLIINLPSGIAQGRPVASVSGRAVTVTTEYSETPSVEAAWVLNQSDLVIQQFRVKRVTINDDKTVTIAGIAYNPNKYAAIDSGAVVEAPPVTVVPPRGQSAPTNITISTSYRVEQGIGITTMEVTWDRVNNAVAYEAQWRQNGGEWINVPRTGNTRFTVDGIYAGAYLVRVRAINALDIASIWGVSAETQLQGKVGKPPAPVGLLATGIAWGIKISWGFPAGAQDTQNTEIQYSHGATFETPLLLSDVPYPATEYTQMGLRAGQQFWYRARLVDRLGNKSDWTDPILGTSSTDLDEIAADILSAMGPTEVFQDLVENAVETSQKFAEVAASVEANADQLAVAVGASRQAAESIINTNLALSDVVVRQSAQNGANSAEFTQMREVIATETEARVTDVTRLEAKTDQNAAQVTQLTQALSDETQARATAVDTLTAQTEDNAADVTQLTQAVSTLDSATASRFDELSGKTANAVGGVQNTAIALIQETLAQVSQQVKQSVQYGANVASIQRVESVVASSNESIAQSLLQLRTDVAGNTSTINSLSQSVSSYQQASATQINALSVTVNGHTSSIATNAQAVADINGNLNAMYSIKVGVDANGRQYAAGMGLGVQNTPGGMQSQVVFLADRFAVMSQAGAAVTLPFVIQNGQTFINDAFFRDASIQFGKITDSLKSDNFVSGPGGAGWNLPKSGNAELNNVTVRGNGEFTGKITATSGTFKGTVQADAFIGDVANAHVFADTEFSRAVTRSFSYTDSGSESADKHVLVIAMFRVETPGGPTNQMADVELWIGNSMRSATIADVNGYVILMHSARVSSPTVSCTLKGTVRETSPGGKVAILAPTLQIYRGSGSFVQTN